MKKIIIGLGNPGKEFQNTYHNIGFLALESFLKNNKHQMIPNSYQGHLYQIQLNNCISFLVKPQMYMNSSGKVVKKILDAYQIKIEDILVILDDIYLPEGKIKLRPQGGHAGHNGLRNIIECCNTNKFKRLKIGVGYDSNIPLNQYLLTPFNLHQKKQILQNIDKIHEIMSKFIQGISFNNLMNQYNVIK
ncbi:Peptidyl-tRNA hydrolase [Candidatus Phytoplasma australiense]|uniref:Peptidyl-tRNA hydrolase n=1 Tax=Phytoplasma australiense TaxID=59748 RepID=PTH_PHYAS|nr:RecName: Full=Peptidyl-tRNA hydrolase; Short=PTH [Candidatus Phytoplasma australiense]CAM11944.1 Peptidyl-tRNA hydrolase [Candidatus Phytoplasma australiense]